MNAICRLVVSIMLASATVARAEDVVGTAIDSADAPIPHAVVRVVGDRFVVITHADDRGVVRVTGLPRLATGAYRIVVERGTFHRGLPPPPHVLRLDRSYFRCCLCAMSHGRTFESVLGAAPVRGHVDTRSTAQRTVIQAPDGPGW